MVDAELRLEVVVFEIFVKFADDGGAEHAFVHDGAAGHGADVEVLGDAGHLRVDRRRLLLGELARDEELALEVVLLGAADEDLLNDGLRRLGHATDDVFVHGNLAPAEDGEALSLDALVEDLPRLFRLRLVLRQEDHADAGIFHGMLHMMPAPSPESSSAEHAPRCSMQPSAVSASATVLCVRSPFSDAMKPTPQASLSSKIWFMSTAPPV